MPHDPEFVLAHSFGHTAFRPGQERVIESLPGALRRQGSIPRSCRTVDTIVAAIAFAHGCRQGRHPGGTKWRTIDPDRAATEMAEPRDRIVKSLGRLSESGSIELKPSGSRQ